MVLLHLVFPRPACCAWNRSKVLSLVILGSECRLCVQVFVCLFLVARVGKARARTLFQQFYTFYCTLFCVCISRLLCDLQCIENIMFLLFVLFISFYFLTLQKKTMWVFFPRATSACIQTFTIDFLSQSNIPWDSRVPQNKMRAKLDAPMPLNREKLCTFLVYT